MHCTSIMLIVPIVIAMILGLGGITTTHALSVSVQCAGTETVTYQPGLLLTSQQVRVQITGTLAPCTSSDPSITSGSYQESFTTTTGCSTLFSGTSGTRVYHWSNGQSSTFSFNRVLNQAGGQTTATLTGTIASGEFTGNTVEEQVTFVDPGTLQCLTSPGLASLGPGAVVLSINMV